MSNIQLGYHLSQSDQEEKRALHEAFDLVTRARHAGYAMRLWAKNTEWESRVLLDRLKKQTELSDEAKLWELACWENKILLALKNYMNDSSDLMNCLKPLNPPLRTDQVRPFREAMLAERTVTVDAMETLTKTVAELTSYKAELGLPNQPLMFDYNPA